MGERRHQRRSITRRDFLGASAGVGAGLALASCTLGGSSSSSSSGAGSNEISLLTWAGPAELKGFKGVAKMFEEQNPDSRVNLEVVPAENAYENFDTRLAAGKAPDVMRLQYQAIGRYSSAGALVDMTDYLGGSDYGSSFTPAVWQSVNFEDKPYGVPHHTDTFAVFYNTQYFDKLGVKAPSDLDQAWSWEEFIDLSKQLKSERLGEYPFAFNWQDAAYRWMPWLHMHGGRLLSEDLGSAEVDAPEGIETIEFLQGWFEDALVPPSTSIKSTEAIESLFANGTIAMMLNGDWLMPFLKTEMKEGDWDITYMPQDASKASDLGGNALAVTKDSANPELAAEFVKFCASEEAMDFFCTTAQFIPVRTSLLHKQPDYNYRPQDMSLFLQQSETVPAAMAAEQTFPQFNRANQVMADELELAFVEGQAADDTARNIASGVEGVLEE